MGALLLGQGGCGDTSWTGDTPRSILVLGDPPPLAGQSQSRWDNDIAVMGTCSLPVGPGDARSQSCSTGWTRQV